MKNSDLIARREAARVRVLVAVIVAIVFAAALFLTSCSPTPKPETRYVTIHCVTQEQANQLKATEPPKVGSQLTGQAQEDLKVVAASAVELRSWGLGLLGVIEGCAG